MRGGRSTGAIGALLLAVAGAGAACTATERVAPLSTPPTSVADTSVASAPPMPTTLITSPRAIVWGTGPVGVVLAHGAAFDAASWTAQAEAIALDGATVVAVEDVTGESLAAAAEQLRTMGVSSVTLIGASAGADAVLRTAARESGLADQLILLSPNLVVEDLGDEPKLFIASEDEPRADVSQQIVDRSAGDRNEVVLVPGAAHAQRMFDSPHADEVLGLILDRLPPAP